jgi:DNA-binding transcriptional ArsR family regulator
VCEVEQILGISQSKASRHLRYLRDSGVLEDQREGLIINYRLPRNQDEQLSAILTMLQGLLKGHEIPDAASLLVQIRASRQES